MPETTAPAAPIPPAGRGEAALTTRLETIAQQADAARFGVMKLTGRLSAAAQDDDGGLTHGAAASVLMALAWTMSDACEAAGALGHWLDHHGQPGGEQLPEELRAIEGDLKEIARRLLSVHTTAASLSTAVGHDRAEPLLGGAGCTAGDEPQGH